MNAKRAAAKDAKEQESLRFEDALQKLEQIVQSLEEGQLGLEESLEQYEQGVGFLKKCYAALESAERKVELLARMGEDGEAEMESFEESEMTLEEKAETRSRRRSQVKKSKAAKRARPNADVDGPDRLF